MSIAAGIFVFALAIVALIADKLYDQLRKKS
jgi:hypothetical protein